MEYDTNPESKKPIVKSEGLNPSEQLLARLCNRVFLELWAYPNPHKKPGKELCDVLAVFENHVFIFSDKRNDFKVERTFKVAWESWKNKAIDRSIRQIQGAERWIRNNPEEIFLDRQCEEKFPLPIDPKNCKFHRIIVAHGAEEACKQYSPDNINGSLGISYSDSVTSKKHAETTGPFTLLLNREEIVHVFDSYNLGIILDELDTVRDLLWYFEAKERAIKKYRVLACSGEEELLADYFCNFDKKSKKRYIGTKDKKISTFLIGDGHWKELTESALYKIKKHADRESRIWDRLLQKTLRHALDGTLTGDGNVFKGESALIEMAKEPRLSRRELSKIIQKSIDAFSPDTNQMMRHVGCYTSFYPDLMYVLFQIPPPKDLDYKTQYRPARIELLEIVCGVVKNRFRSLKKVVGIGIDPPKLNQGVSEDFILLDCEHWTKKDRDDYEKANKETGLNVFVNKKLKMIKGTNYEFPREKNNAVKKPIKTKPGRNDSCPCGSGKKYKKCCLGRGN